MAELNLSPLAGGLQVCGAIEDASCMPLGFQAKWRKRAERGVSYQMVGQDKISLNSY